MHRLGRLWLLAAVIALLLVFALLAYLIVPRLLLLYAVHKDISPSQKVQLHAFFHDAIDIPKDWQDIRPFPRDLLELVRKLREQYESVGMTTCWPEVEDYQMYDRLQAAEPLSPKEWSLAVTRLPYDETLIEDVISLVRHPSYELSAFPQIQFEQSMSHHLFLQNISRQLLFQAYFEAHQRNSREAFNLALIALSLCIRHPASFHVSHKFSFGIEAEASQALANLAEQCDQQEVLQSALKEMDILAPRINHDVMKQAVLVEVIATLRAAKGQGAVVDLSPRKPLIHFLKQIHSLNKQHPDISLGLVGEYLHDPYIRRFGYSSELYFFRVLQEELWGINREKVARSKFDLARMTLTKRIRELESGVVIQNEDQIRGTFKEKFVDPFSQKPYQWDPHVKSFYSLGPDGRDDFNRIIYDPTNGEISSGDISVHSYHAP